MAKETQLDKLMREQREYLTSPAYQQDQAKAATHAEWLKEWMKGVDAEREKLGLPGTKAAAATAAPVLKYPALTQEQMKSMRATDLLEYSLGQEREQAALAAAGPEKYPTLTDEQFSKMSVQEKIIYGMHQQDERESRAAHAPPTPYTPPENWRERSPSEQIEIGLKMDRAAGLSF